MTDIPISSDPGGSFRHWIRRLVDFGLRPRTLVIVAALTLVVSTAVLYGWIVAHRNLWYSEWACGSRFGLPTAFRQFLTLAAAASFGTVAVATLSLSRRRSRRPTAVFWIATTALWLVMAIMVATIGYDVCGMGQPL